jgi:predicted lipoprotein with Yx(FWY)xxD motif
MHRLLALTSALAAVAVAGCGSDDDPGATGADAMAKPPAMKDTKAAAASGATAGIARAAKRRTAIRVVDSQYGRILAARRGQAVYLFDKETSAHSRCYGACAKAWPPVLTKGRPVARTGAKASLLGTTRRRDGSRQVTYRGQPLYYYVADAPGRVLCHDVAEFGGTWLVLRSSGKAVS